MVRVLMISWDLYPQNVGGAGKSLYYTAEGLAKLDEVDKIVILTSGVEDEVEMDEKGKIIILRDKNLQISFNKKNGININTILKKINNKRIERKWEKRIKQIVSQYSLDIIHCNEFFTLRRLKNNIKKVPTLISIRGSWISSPKGIKMFDEQDKIWSFKDSLNYYGLMGLYRHLTWSKDKRLLKKLKALHFVSDFSMKESIEYSEKVNLELPKIKRMIKNPRPIRHNKNKNKEQNSICYVGELTEKKGVHKLLEAMNILKSEDINPKLYIAGVGDQEHILKKYAKKNKLNVKFLGWINNPEELYNKCILTVIPSIWCEPFSGVVTEVILNNGIPIVSKYGGMPETVPTKELVVDSNEPKEIANKIKELINNKNKQQEIIKKYDSWLEQFDIEKLAKEYLNLYKEILIEK